MTGERTFGVCESTRVEVGIVQCSRVRLHLIHIKNHILARRLLLVINGICASQLGRRKRIHSRLCRCRLKRRQEMAQRLHRARKNRRDNGRKVPLTGEAEHRNSGIAAMVYVRQTLPSMGLLNRNMLQYEPLPRFHYERRDERSRLWTPFKPSTFVPVISTHCRLKELSRAIFVHCVLAMSQRKKSLLLGRILEAIY